MGNSGSKGGKGKAGPAVHADRSARVIRFRAYMYDTGERRSDGDPLIHSGVHVVTTSGSYFVDRLAEDGTQARSTKEADYSDIWAEPKWTVTIQDLIDAGNQGTFNMATNNCLHAAQRMVRRMGRLEELMDRAKNWGYLPEAVKRKLLRFAII